MKHPDYLSKARGKTLQTGEELVGYLETLNRNDWVHLLADIASHPQTVEEVFNPSPGLDLLSYVATFLAQLSVEMRRLIESAVNELIAVNLPYKGKRKSKGILLSMLDLCSLMSFSPNIVLVTRIIVDESVDQTLRSKAALTLLASEDSSIWQEFDLSKHKYLIPIQATACAQTDPHQTFQLFADTKDPQRYSWETPVHVALSVLSAQKDGATWLRRFVDSLDEAHLIIIEESPGYGQLLKKTQEKVSPATPVRLLTFPKKIGFYYRAVTGRLKQMSLGRRVG